MDGALLMRKRDSFKHCHCSEVVIEEFLVQKIPQKLNLNSKVLNFHQSPNFVLPYFHKYL